MPLEISGVDPTPAPGSGKDLARWIPASKLPRRALVVCAALVGLLLYDGLLVEFMHDRRQDRLVSEFNAAATSSEIRFGDPIALIQIPDIDVNAVVVEGDSQGNLRAGPAHRIGTALPGSAGNAVILGKSHRYGAPFSGLARLQPGDEVFVMRRATQPVRYVVDEVVELGPSDTSAFEPVDGGRITLVTSKSWLSRTQLVVIAIADDSSILEPASGVVAGLKNDKVSGSDLGVVVPWMAAIVALVFVLRRSRARLPRATRLVIFGPLLGVATLQLLLAAERLLPSTV